MRLREDRRARTAEAQEQRAVIEAAYRDLTDSIRYSQHIQQAVVPDTILLGRYTAGHFLLHRPKDFVSGDLPWCAPVEGRTVWAVADHTGHGVPGALMSILGCTLLHGVVVEQRVDRPAEILDRLREAFQPSTFGKRIRYRLKFLHSGIVSVLRELGYLHMLHIRQVGLDANVASGGF